MKILLIVDSYYPSRKSAAKHFFDLATELTARGHEPTVLTISQDISTAFEHSVEHGIPVLRVRMPELKTHSRVLRAWRELRLPLTVWLRAKNELKAQRFELIVFYSPTIFWGPLVARLKALYGCPSYLYLRDIFPRWAVEAGLLRKGPPYYLFRLFEQIQYYAADRIAVQASGDISHFATAPKSIRDKIDVVYNWAPKDEGVLPIHDFRRELGLEGKIIFFFGGTFGQAQNMDAIVRLAISLRDDPSVFFLLAGSGTEEVRIRKWVETERLPNFRIIPSLDQRDYLALVSEVDVGLLSLAPTIRTDNIPGKSLSYAYFSKPVLASLNTGTELEQLIVKFDAGLVSIADDEELFVRNARDLAGDASMRKLKGANNRRLYDTMFSIEPAITKLMELAHSRPCDPA